MIAADLARCDIMNRDCLPSAKPAKLRVRARDLAGARRAGSVRLRRRHRLRRGRGLAVRQVAHRRRAAVRERPIVDHMPRCPHRPRVLDCARRIGCSEAAQRGDHWICAATLLWTIVVLRDGRRCRSWRADVAQLVAHHLAKVRVAGSNPVIRSRCSRINPSGGVAEW